MAAYTIEIIDITKNSENIESLYNSLMDFKNKGIIRMGDAAASKILHILIPELFVMWDKKVKQTKRYLYYSNFLIDTQNFIKSIKIDFDKSYPGIDIEEFLQDNLKYPLKKTTAKFVDEFNWYQTCGYAR